MNWKEDPRWAYVFVNLSCLMWASNFVLGRTLREEIGPLMLTASRFVVASLFYGDPRPLCRQGATALPALGFADSHGTDRGTGISRPSVSGSSTHDGNRCRADQRHWSAHDGGPGCDPAKGAIIPPSCSWWIDIVFRRDADRQRGLVRKAPAVACECR